jgi:hypothetical protein
MTDEDRKLPPPSDILAYGGVTLQNAVTGSGHLFFGTYQQWLREQPAWSPMEDAWLEEEFQAEADLWAGFNAPTRREYPNVEVTTEMIEAGVRHAHRLDPRCSTEEDYACVVSDIFRTMLSFADLSDFD